MLEFSGEWRYDSPGEVMPEVELAFRQLIEKVCVQGQRKGILEHFKHHFASAAGVQHYNSSDVSWASTDLERVMSLAAENAPLFIEAFYDACKALENRYPEMAIPGIERINRILSDTNAGYYVDPPRLVANSEHIPIPVPDNPTPLHSKANAEIEDALRASERALGAGNGRQAIREVLWVLETVSTVFRDEKILNGEIRGDYFNKIINDLRRQGQGHQKPILEWMMNLHGYLSSPQGGGIRHGVDLKEGLELGINEARLFCNLIRSYLTYLISEYERLRRNST